MNPTRTLVAGRRRDDRRDPRQAQRRPAPPHRAAGAAVGPFDPAVSPDGTTVAYTHSFAAYVLDWLETGSNIRYAKTDGSSGAQQYPGVSTGASTPSWIDGGRTLVGRGSVGYVQQPGAAATQWWSVYDHYSIFGEGADLSDGELAGGRLVMLRGRQQTGNAVAVYSTPEGLAGTPVYSCTLSQPSPGPNGAAFADPTLSADGRRVYTQEGDGIWLMTTPSAASCDGATNAKLIDGGAEPDWGPADVNPGPRRAAAVTKAQRAKAKRARAIASCRRTKRGKALARCLRAAKRAGVR